MCDGAVAEGRLELRSPVILDLDDVTMRGTTVLQESGCDLCYIRHILPQST
jgi:hypothetical protein